MNRALDETLAISLERAIDGLEHDSEFDLERFLAELPGLADELRARIEKLRRSGMLHPARSRAEPTSTRAIAGRYRVLRELGRGGMGRVLLARDERLARDVAVKLVHDVDDAAAGARLERESQLLAQLEHPGIVALYDGGATDDGRAFCAMRVVGGRSLHDLITDPAVELGLARKVHIATLVCDAIRFAHSRGIVHRDLKPANVMVGETGEVQVVDWGLAKRTGAPDPRDTARSDSFASFATGAYETVDGYAFGTPSYCAPEQARGELAEIDERSDVFGLGAILHHLLAGRPPYYGRSRDEVVARAQAGHLNDPELTQAETSVPAELVAVCRKATASDKAARYATARELADDLRAFIEMRTVRAYRSGAWEEAKKWLVRNRRFAIAVACAVVALVAGLITTLVYQGRAHANELAARDATRTGELNAAIARAQSDTARDMGVVIENLIPWVGRESTEDQAESIAAKLTQLADAQGELGNYALAEVSWVRALAILEQHGGDPLRRAHLGILIARARRELNRLDEAERALADAGELIETSLGWESAVGLAWLNERAILRRRRGDATGAVEDYEHLVALADGAGESVDPLVLNNLATALLDVQRFDDAERCIERALASYEAAPARELRTGVQLWDTANVIAMKQGRFEDAEKRALRVVELRLLLNGSDARETLRAQHNLAAAQAQCGKRTEAIALLQRVLQTQRDRFGESDGDTLASARALAELTGSSPAVR